MSIMATDDLMATPDEEFRVLVAEALKVGNHDYSGPLTPEVVDALKSPEVVNRTYLTLIAMKKNVEGQLAAKRADYVRERSRLHDGPNLRAKEQEYHSWRAGALRFKSGVEEFMVSVRGKRERPDDNYYLAYETLRQAILTHKSAVLLALEHDEDTDADEALWTTVSND